MLGVYRIPHGREGPGPASGPPVLLQHGLLDSSATWVLNEPDELLAFILADAGYDVWLGNSRGDAFSWNHTGLSPDSAAFWAFTMDEMALLDVPALLEHVRRATGAAKVAYVGHSQGSTPALAALSARGSPAARVTLGPLAGRRRPAGADGRARVCPRPRRGDLAAGAYLRRLATGLRLGARGRLRLRLGQR